jgi:thiamine-phosphate diphosphorylase
MQCLVTDRHRLRPDAVTFAAARQGLVEQAAWAARAGVDMLQVRERDLEGGPLAALVSALLDVSRGSPLRVIVNDRLDIALACGAHGVHLRHDSLQAADVRRLAPPGFLVGRSVHGVAEALTAGPVDYLIAGTVFRTASKSSEAPLLGTDGLAAVAKAAGVPVLAIGGVRADHFEELAAAGAAGVAGIGLFIDRFDRFVTPS